MKKRWMIVITMGVLLMGGLLGAKAGNVAGDPTANGPLARLINGQFGRWLQLRSQLHLTSEQRETIKSVLQSHRSEIANVVQPLVDKRRELRDLTNASAPDESAIRSAANELGKAAGDAAVLAAKIKGELRPTLTTAQIDTLANFKKQSDSSVDDFLHQLQSQ